MKKVRCPYCNKILEGDIEYRTKHKEECKRLLKTPDWHLSIWKREQDAGRWMREKGKVIPCRSKNSNHAYRQKIMKKKIGIKASKTK